VNGLNDHGCVFAIQYDDAHLGRLTRFYGTLDGFRDALVFKCEETRDESLEESLGSTMEWAEKTKPGGVDCFFGVLWIFALDINLDAANLISELEDYEEWEKLKVEARRR
jgi:hypothetical protein